MLWCGVVQYLEYVSFEDVVSQLHGLLPVQLPLLPGEHEGQEGVATPAGRTPSSVVSSRTHHLGQSLVVREFEQKSRSGSFPLCSLLELSAG